MIVAEKVEGDIGTTLETSEVLLVGTRDSTIVGRPTVPGATVKLFVEEQTKDKKVRCGPVVVSGSFGGVVLAGYGAGVVRCGKNERRDVVVVMLYLPRSYVTSLACIIMERLCVEGLS